MWPCCCRCAAFGYRQLNGLVSAESFCRCLRGDQRWGASEGRICWSAADAHEIERRAVS